jgi:hypothetical protein
MKHEFVLNYSKKVPNSPNKGSRYFSPNAFLILAKSLVLILFLFAENPLIRFYYQRIGDHEFFGR